MQLRERLVNFSVCMRNCTSDAHGAQQLIGQMEREITGWTDTTKHCFKYTLKLQAIANQSCVLQQPWGSKVSNKNGTRTKCP